MRKSLIQFLLMAVLSAYTAVAWSQTTVRGQLVDAETGEPLVGAAVMVEGTTDDPRCCDAEGCGYHFICGSGS